MWKNYGVRVRTAAIAIVVAGSLGTAAFAFTTTAHAKEDRCCLVITTCWGNSCEDDDQCDDGNGFCCSFCEI